MLRNPQRRPRAKALSDSHTFARHYVPSKAALYLSQRGLWAVVHCVLIALSLLHGRVLPPSGHW